MLGELAVQLVEDGFGEPLKERWQILVPDKGRIAEDGVKRCLLFGDSLGSPSEEVARFDRRAGPTA